jgi:hypothetical protein
MYTEFNGAAGIDNLQAGLATTSVSGIRGPIVYNASTDGGSVLIGSAGSLPATMHQTASTIGAYAGDNLFGAGGSLTFSGVTNNGANAGVRMVVASGSTVYAQPLASAQVSLTSGFIFQAPSGSMKLATAAVQNPVINGTPASGSLASSNRQTLFWSNFAGSIQTDAVAPAVLQAGININGVPGFADSGTKQSVDVQFSENVSGLISPASLALTNLTTNQVIPTANIAVEYELATNTAHFTFPGYPNGILPDGDYSGKILAGLPDFFGNALPADANFSFFFLNGDANRDRIVNSDDFNILATNFGLSGKTFSQGNFNYDPAGLVNSDDFNILATNFGIALGAGGSAVPPSAGAGFPLKPWPFAGSGAAVAPAREADSDILSALLK